MLCHSSLPQVFCENVWQPLVKALDVSRSGGRCDDMIVHPHRVRACWSCWESCENVYCGMFNIPRSSRAQSPCSDPVRRYRCCGGSDLLSPHPLHQLVACPVQLTCAHSSGRALAFAIHRGSISSCQIRGGPLLSWHVRIDKLGTSIGQRPSPRPAGGGSCCGLVPTDSLWPAFARPG